jgi:hypothetical protein
MNDISPLAMKRSSGAQRQARPPPAAAGASAFFDINSILNYLILLSVALSIIELLVSSEIMHNLASNHGHGPVGDSGSSSTHFVLELIIFRLVCIFGTFATRSTMVDAWAGSKSKEFVGIVLCTGTMFFSLMSFFLQMRNYEYLVSLEVRDSIALFRARHVQQPQRAYLQHFLANYRGLRAR